MKNRQTIFRLAAFLLISLCISSCNNQEENLLGEKPRMPDNIIDPTFVTQTKAVDIAKLFLVDSSEDAFTKSGNSTKTTKSIDVVKDNAGNPLLYVINYNGGGFVLVSATTNYYPILAFSDTNEFIVNKINMNWGVIQWLEQTKEAVSESVNLEGEEVFQIAAQWYKYKSEIDVPEQANTKSSDNRTLYIRRMTQLKDYGNDGWRFSPLTSHTNSHFYNYAKNMADYWSSPYEYTIVGVKEVVSISEVGPLLSTTWDQRDPYNALCPNQFLAGCVAIATAQIMKFHQHPANVFNWSNMPNRGATWDTQNLIKSVGQAVNMRYGIDGSSSNIYEAENALRNYGYTVTMASHNDSNVETELLTHRRPVYMRGVSAESEMGHAWVCDGSRRRTAEYFYYIEYLHQGAYDNFGETLIELPGQSPSTSFLYAHMNWGWGGLSDGWYYTASTNPAGIFNYDRQNLFIKKN